MFFVWKTYIIISKNIYEKKLCSSVVVVLLLGFGLTLSSCESLGKMLVTLVPPEGYGTLTVTNNNSSLNITSIYVNGNNFSQNYNVNLRKGSFFYVGNEVRGAEGGKITVVPLGEYNITVIWSDGRQSSTRANVRNANGIGVNFVNP